MAGPERGAWEALWAPYDEDTYQQALSFVPEGAVVLDIGAGDLRFARRLAARARVVYAVERNRALLTGPVPANVRVASADARAWPFPADIEIAVLLMRHCAHFALYRRKLEALGARRLITNARWGMGVECIDLTALARPYGDVAAGWYACHCGATGFRSAPPETLLPRDLEGVHEVANCPECNPNHYGRNSHCLP